MEENKRNVTQISMEMKYRKIIIIVSAVFLVLGILFEILDFRDWTLGIIIAAVYLYGKVFKEEGFCLAMVFPLVLFLFGTSISYKKIWMNIISLICLAVLVQYFIAFYKMHKYSAKAEKAKTGTIIVLGCAVKNGKPSEELQRRLDKAYKLAKDNPDASLILSGGAVNESISEASVMKEYLIEKGIDSKRLFTEDESVSTLDNFYRIKEKYQLKDNPVFVTSDYHIYRSLCIALKAEVNVKGVSVETPYKVKAAPWCREPLNIWYMPKDIRRI